MIIPEIDQRLASIKATDIQLSSGYYLSESDYRQFIDAMTHTIYLYNQVQNQRRKDGKEVVRAT